MKAGGRTRGRKREACPNGAWLVLEQGGYYLGSGRSPGYAVANLGARYDITKWLQFFGQINYLFNRQYVTAAQLGPTGFTSTGAFIARLFAAVDGDFPVVHATFYSPGAPRSAWGGVRIKF
jgi:outer membrane receptor protein involved in Fe transport